jgi:glycosyltransferase involved in cell wall biosynthesis
MIDPENFYVVPNGVDPYMFYAEERPVNDRKMILYTSSPDRGLHHVFPIVERMRQEMDCELHIFYNVARWTEAVWWQMDEAALRAHQVYEGMALPWVTYHGPVSRGELAVWYRRADLLCYPCDTIWPTEVFPTTVLESMACGCVPLLGACDSLPELFGKVAPMLPLPIDYDQWASAALALLKDDRGFRDKGLEFSANYTWERIAPLWEAEYSREVQHE